MQTRNFLFNHYWNKITENHQPLMSFKGRDDFSAWQPAARAKLLELLGDFPAKVEPRPQLEYSVVDGDLIRERVVFATEEFMALPCQVLRPQNMLPDRTNAAILCCHGHGRFGKDPVAGLRSSPEMIDDINQQNYNFAETMARAGYLTIAPDLRGFGERSEGHNPYPGSDQCDVNFIKGALLGIWPLTLNIWDMKCCIDYLETRAEVDPDRIGMMGLSYGGTMTTFTTAVEPRIKAADIMGYINPFREFAIKRANFCGVQMIPFLYKYFDTDDIAGLIAPRPLMIDMSIADDCFYLQDMLQGYAGVEKIYQAAGAADRLWPNIHSGAHSFGADKALAFFAQYL